jgi:hypothetical protein
MEPPRNFKGCRAETTPETKRGSAFFKIASHVTVVWWVGGPFMSRTDPSRARCSHHPLVLLYAPVQRSYALLSARPKPPGRYLQKSLNGNALSAV